MHHKEFDSRKLLKELKEGNKAAAEYLYRQHHKAACQHIYRLIHDLDNTEVIYFEVFQLLLLQTDSFNSLEEIKKFLLDSITEASIKFLQDQDGETKGTLECVNSTSELASSEDLKCKRIEMEVAQEINDIISGFPRRHYLVCKFYYLEKKRNKDVAEDLNLSPQDVYKSRKRCAKWLKKTFDKKDACRQFYWLLFLSDRFKIDAGIDKE